MITSPYLKPDDNGKYNFNSAFGGMNSSFVLYNDPIQLSGNKRYRDELYNFSPNLLRPITPIYNANTPLNIPAFFMFNNNNNSLTPTPLPNKSNNNQQQRKEEFDYSTIKTDTQKDDSSVNNTINNTININNNPMPTMTKNSNGEYSNMVLVPTPVGNNLGFYTWVMHGSPHPNLNNNNTNNININSNNVNNNKSNNRRSKRSSKLRKNSYKNEETN